MCVCVCVCVCVCLCVCVFLLVFKLILALLTKDIAAVCEPRHEKPSCLATEKYLQTCNKLCLETNAYGPVDEISIPIHMLLTYTKYGCR